MKGKRDSLATGSFLDYKKLESVAIMMECYNNIVFDRFV